MTQDLPIIATKAPLKIEVKAGKKYFWCSCGASSNQPFCDGKHRDFKDEAGQPIMRSVVYEADEDKAIYFCGCKHSKNGIFCDGSHNSL